MSQTARHGYGVAAGLLLSPLIAAGLMFGVGEIVLAVQSSRTFPVPWLGIATVVPSAVLLGLLAGSRLSPLASLIPGLLFTFLNLLWLVQLVPLQIGTRGVSLFDGYGYLLSTGAFLLAGVLLLTASVFPSRWRMATWGPPPRPYRLQPEAPAPGIGMYGVPGGRAEEQQRGGRHANRGARGGRGVPAGVPAPPTPAWEQPRGYTDLSPDPPREEPVPIPEPARPRAEERYAARPEPQYAMRPEDRYGTRGTARSEDYETRPAPQPQSPPRPRPQARPQPQARQGDRYEPRQADRYQQRQPDPYQQPQPQQPGPQYQQPQPGVPDWNQQNERSDDTPPPTNVRPLFRDGRRR